MREPLWQPLDGADQWRLVDGDDELWLPWVEVKGSESERSEEED